MAPSSSVLGTMSFEALHWLLSTFFNAINYRTE
jgi:hypothetical protein